MTDQEKINKMAQDICRVKHNCNDVCNPINSCMALKYAYRAYLAGYRLQSEVASEVLQQVRQTMLNMVLANSMGENYDVEKCFAEIEKKYTEGQK